MKLLTTEQLEAMTRAKLIKHIEDHNFPMPTGARPTKLVLIKAVETAQKAEVKKEEKKPEAKKEEKPAAETKKPQRATQRALVEELVNAEYTAGSSRRDILAKLQSRFGYTTNTASTMYSKAILALGIESNRVSSINAIQEWLIEHPKTTKEEFCAEWVSNNTLAQGTANHYWNSFQFAISLHKAWSK